MIDRIEVVPHLLDFKFEAGTSRGVLKQKKTSFVKVYVGDRVGVGEAGPLAQLSIDDIDGFELVFEQELQSFVGKEVSVDLAREVSPKFPSLRFGFETALLSVLSEDNHVLFDTAFSQGQEGISINGLVWMGDKDLMFSRLKEKIDAGFTCVKMKIGAIDFSAELELLKYVRTHFSAKDITLRVDANGAFAPNEALTKLELLSEFDLHSIEQPIRQGQFDEMSRLCEVTPLPIALDEELINVVASKRGSLLERINPQFIILKPSLVGGLNDSQQWINEAEKRNIDWWMTSALESNIGLNAIAQFTSKTGNPLPQGLGTGQLYNNNIGSPLNIMGEKLWYSSSQLWDEV